MLFGVKLLPFNSYDDFLQHCEVMGKDMIVYQLIWRQIKREECENRLVLKKLLIYNTTKIYKYNLKGRNDGKQ